MSVMEVFAQQTVGIPDQTEILPEQASLCWPSQPSMAISASATADQDLFSTRGLGDTEAVGWTALLSDAVNLSSGRISLRLPHG
jgi:hypothetical protein